MRFVAVLVLAFAVVPVARAAEKAEKGPALQLEVLPDEPVAPQKAKKPRKVIVFKDPFKVSGDAPPEQYVMTRSQLAKDDLERAGDHLDDAARRR